MNYTFLHVILQARILQWVAIHFSRGSSWSRDGTRVSCIEDRFFTLWANREALFICSTTELPLNTYLQEIKFY